LQQSITPVLDLSIFLMWSIRDASIPHCATVGGTMILVMGLVRAVRLRDVLFAMVLETAWPAMALSFGHSPAPAARPWMATT
jgi:hypothetical protein